MELDNQPNQQPQSNASGPAPGPAPGTNPAPAPGPAPGPIPPQPQQPMSNGQQQYAPNQQKSDTLGIISLVLIILFPLAGAIVGFVGMSKAKSEGYSGTLSKIGAIVNTILVVLGLLFFVWIFVAADNIVEEAERIQNEQTSLTVTDGRADTQATDIEVEVGQAATIRGVDMTVTRYEYAASLGEYNQAESGKTYLLFNVKIANNSSETQSYSAFDFRLQTDGGQVLDPTYVFEGAEPELDTADLVAGGSVEGNIVFEVPIEDAEQFIIWKPGFEADRAIIPISQ